MKQSKIFLVLVLGLALVTSGCFKKKTEEASLKTETGFDSLNGTEELAQLPQSNASNKQGQGAVEVLPIETSPVTQSAGSASTTAASGADTTASQAASLTHPQQIQTALKNAGLYDGPIDGKIGPKTKKAIAAFQSQNNLKADGKVGPKTWSVLEKFLNGAPAADTSSSSASQDVTTENPQ